MFKHCLSSILFIFLEKIQDIDFGISLNVVPKGGGTTYTNSLLNKPLYIFICKPISVNFSRDILYQNISVRVIR